MAVAAAAAAPAAAVAAVTAAPAAAVAAATAVEAEVGAIPAVAGIPPEAATRLRAEARIATPLSEM